MGLYPRRYEFRSLYLRIIEHTVFGHEVVAVHRRNIVEPFVTVQTHGHGRPVGLLDLMGRGYDGTALSSHPQNSTKRKAAKDLKVYDKLIL